MLISGKEQTYIVHDDNNIKGFFDEYRWMSNFHPSLVVFEGDTYGSTEAAYQAAKANKLSDRAEFMSLDPSQSKKRGQEIEFRPDWDEVKYDLMSVIVFDKFYRHKDLREKLLATGDKYLEESNHWNDATWGVYNGEGKNWLGQILMGIRDFWKRKA
jgi:ribA/ribD-fused uncharacterized protein